MRTRTIFILSLIFCVILGNLGINGLHAEKDGEQTLEEAPLVPGWSKDVRLSDADGKDSLYPSIDRSSSNIYIVWQDDVSEEYWGIYFRKSTNYGVTWENKKLVVTNGEHPCIATDENGGIHLVYSRWVGDNCEIFYTKSVDEGSIWSSETRLTNFEGHSTGPIIGIYQSIIHLIWCDQRDGNMEVYYKKSIDLGDTWDEEDIRLTNAPDVSWPQSLAIDSNGDVHIVWNDKRDGNVQVYYKRVTNGEESLSEDVRLTKDPAESREPTLCIDSHDNVHVAWADYRSQKVREDIFYKRSTDGGNTWSDDINITKQSYADSFMPNIIADLNNNLHLIWKTSNRSDNSNDFYYKKIGDTNNISSPTIRLTNAVYGGRMWPKMIMDEKNLLHVVWYDQREDDNQTLEVYYKRTLNPITEPPIMVTQSLNQTSCKPGDSITVSGNAVYNDSIVPNANVSIKILETGDEWNTTTYSNGDYSKTITAPDIVGNYTIRVTITSGNHTGWKQMRLAVEQESTNGGTTNGDGTNGGTTNGGQQPDGGENKYGNLNYVLAIVAVVVVCVISAVVLVKHRGKKPAKVKEEKKPTQMLRCPKCRKTFSVEVKPKPFSVKCPYCGKEGAIK